jgi:outer membrane receptor protein involved in Fe transport
MMPRPRRARRPVVLALVAALWVPHAAADNPAEIFELPPVDVVGTTPLPGLGVPLRDVPANVQIFGNRLLQRQRPPTLAQFLDLNANSTNAAAGQGNPFQQSVDFRGFSASPILGAPQGVSVFQDGVRVNEPFGDIMNWDLLPRSAISSVQMIPGSVPAFGLNTLGGALAIYTKSGAQYPGASAEITGGSWRTRSVGFEAGGARGAVDGFIAGNFYDDDGWADHNPSRVRQFFGKVGYQDDVTDLDVSLSLADNKLQGTQTLPLSYLDDPKQAYTFPDENDNKLAFIAAKGSRFLNEQTLLGGNLYYRHYKSSNFSSNVNDGFGEVDPDTGLVQTNDAINDRSTIDQKGWGLGLQVTWQGELAGMKHQVAVGASGDFGDTRFFQDEQTATFTPDRGADGTSPFVRNTDVAMRNAYTGVFAADTIVLHEQWTLSIAGRYNRATVDISDRSGEDPQLDGSHAFTRFNPAVGVNWNPDPRLTLYTGYNEGMRAPTPIELTCADPTAPCKLPNQFLADPPLSKVVSKTFELGARGKLGAVTSWSVAAYRTDLDNDIQFVSSNGATNAGFFQNVGSTRRQGIELFGGTRVGPVDLTLRYNHIDATFRSTFIASSPSNSTADANGSIVVQPGNKIPGIPSDTLKLRAEVEAGAWSFGASVVAASSQFAHGDENNADVHGKVPGYTVVHLDGQWNPTPRLSVFAQVTNLFDRQYYNFALLGQNVFTGPGRTFGPASGVDPVPEQFRALGTPRGIFVGVRYAFGGPKPNAKKDAD